jgi:hypothetical protein
MCPIDRGGRAGKIASGACAFDVAPRRHGAVSAVPVSGQVESRRSGEVS